MASFDLTANINARLNAGNVRAIANQLRNQLSVTASVNVRLANNTSQGIKTLTGSLATLNKELVAITNNSTNANKALVALGNAFQNINSQLSQTAKSQQALNNIANQAHNAGTQMEQFGKQAGLAFRRFAGFRIASGIVTEFVGAVTGAISEAVKFQRELVKISQVTGRSLGSLTSLTDEITRLSVSLGVSSSELIDISRVLSQAGLSATQTQQALEALAKSSLAPTFTNMGETAEGAIAIFKQFGIQAGQLGAALGSINAVSGQFAVESDDIIAAVKRAGGVFAATSQGVSSGIDALNEFVAVFTSVRATTRESAESIATGLRTIFTRIQRPRTIEFLQELGINLLDVEGKFVGPFDAINKISGALQNLDTRDPQFAKLVEELGGFRQVGKVIPLLTEQETRLKALAVAKAGQNSLDKDAETAQQALAVQLQRVREEFLALVRGFSETSTFRSFVKTTLDLASALIKLADSIQPVLPLLAGFAAFKGASAITQFGKGLFGRGGIRFHNGGYVGRQSFANGGDIRPRGIVPGGRGVRDDVAATLQTGEFVIRRRAVDAIGQQNLEQINRTGQVEFATGGLVGQKAIGAALLQPLDKVNHGSFSISKKQVPTLETPNKSFVFKREALGKEDKKLVTDEIVKGATAGIIQGAKALAGTNFSSGSARRIFETTNPSGVLGSLFEGVLQGVNSDGKFDGSDDPSRPFDFVNGFNSILGKKFQTLAGVQYIDAKISDKAASKAGLKKKTINQLNLEANIGQKVKPPKKLTDKQQILADKKAARIAAIKAKNAIPKAAPLGKIPFATGGDVPALLTRGEFVVNKRAARSIGSPMLNALNNADRSGFANGGRVGFGSGGQSKQRRRFILGGAVLDKAINDLIQALDTRTTSKGPGRSKKRTQIVRDRIGKHIKQQGQTVGTAAYFAGSQIGGITGATISGAAVGAGLGSAIPVYGTAIGAFVGGVVGALNSIADSDLDTKIAATTKSVNEALSEAEKGFADFLKGGSIQNLTQSFQKVSGASQDIVTQSLSQQSGLGGNLLGMLSDSPEDARRSSISGATFKEAVVDGFTSGVTPALSLVALTSALTGGSSNAFTAGLLGAGKAGIIGGLATPETFVSATTGIAAEKRRAAADLQIGKDIQSTFAPVAENARKVFERLVIQGETAVGAGRKLGTGGQIALATSIANNRQLEALGGASDEEARAQIALGILRDNAGKQLRKQILLENKLAEGVGKTNATLDTFINDLEDVAAAITRAGDAGEEFSRRNTALLGNGIVSSATVNPFANPRAFSNEELSRATSNVVEGLGGGSEGFAGELQKGLSTFNDLTSRLPQVLSNVVLNKNDSSQSQLKDIETAIKDEFPDLPKAITNKLLNDLRTQTETSPQAGSLRQFAQNGARELAQISTKEWLEVGNRYVEVQNKAITEYEQAVGQWIGLQQQANSNFDDVVSRDIQNRNQIISLDRNLSFDELTAGFTTQQNRDARRSGAGGSDLQSILSRLQQIDIQRQVLQSKAAEFQNLGGKSNVAKSNADALAQLRLQQVSAETVLKQIATNTQITAAATQKLQEIENSKKTSQQLAEDFISADPLERFQQQRQLNLANAFRGGAQLSGDNARAALQGIRVLGGLEGRTSESIDNEIRKLLANNPLVERLFQQGGRSAQDALVRSPEEDRLRTILNNNSNIQNRAGLAVGNRDQNVANEFFENSAKRFGSVISALANTLKNFDDTVASIPKQIEFAGSVAVNVNINGDEALKSLSPNIEAIVRREINIALRRNIDATQAIENK